MALSTQQADNDEGYVLLAKIDNARHVSNILKAVHFKEVNNEYMMSV
jgi:cell cycle checkpoint protein